tara:strand:- start:467 stop:643 length:177 start_codon:yes stop_codon:yes gene_type:complete
MMMQILLQKRRAEQLAKERQAKQVRDRKTGELYNPQQKFDEMMNKPEILASLKRLSGK